MTKHNAGQPGGKVPGESKGPALTPLWGLEPLIENDNAGETRITVTGGNTTKRHWGFGAQTQPGNTSVPKLQTNGARKRGFGKGKTDSRRPKGVEVPVGNDHLGMPSRKPERR